MDRLVRSSPPTARRRRRTVRPTVAVAFRLALLLLVGGSAVAAPPAEAVVPGKNGLIVCVNALGARSVLMVTTSKGNKPTQITPDGDIDAVPRRSPDGSRLLFVRFANLTDPSCDVWSVKPDGSDPRNLTNGSGGGAAWSPDGTRVVYVKPDSGQSSLWTMQADGSNRSRLVLLGTDRVGTVDWSPDGARIVYDQLADGGLASQVWVVNADGSHATLLTSGGGYQTISAPVAGRHAGRVRRGHRQHRLGDLDDERGRQRAGGAPGQDLAQLRPDAGLGPGREVDPLRPRVPPATGAGEGRQVKGARHRPQQLRLHPRLAEHAERRLTRRAGHLPSIR